MPLYGLNVYVPENEPNPSIVIYSCYTYVNPLSLSDKSVISS